MHILVTMSSESPERNRDWANALQARLPEARLTVYEGGKAPSDVDYLVTWRPPAGLFAELPQLRAVFNVGAGVDAILSAADLPDCPVVRLHDAGMGRQMADYALLAGLYIQRGFDRLRTAQNEQQWRPALGPARGRPTVGILGLGTLGHVVAEALRANAFPVRGWSRSRREIDGVDCFAGLDELEDFLAETELLFCLLPHTPDTEKLLNRARLAALPTGAVVVNVARGAIVDEDALLDALDEGHVRAALLDVFHVEPLPREHRFWTHPNVLVTPHIAAATLIGPSADSIVDGINRLEHGETPLGTVDRQRGY